MLNIEELNNFQRDVLKEIGNIGAGHAATALSQLLVEKVDMTVPSVAIIPFQQASEILGGPEQLVVAVYTQVYGDVPGKIIFFFSMDEALNLTDMLFERKTGTSKQLDDLRESALREIVNIMTGAYLNALIRFTDLNLLSTVPVFVCDMAGAIINTALSELGALGDYALLI